MIILQVVILGMLRGLVYALMAIGLSLIAGVMGVINLAHGAFLVVAAYLALILFRVTSLDPFMAIPVVAAAGFLLGMILYHRLFARLSVHPQFQEITVLVTFGLALVIEGLLTYFFTGVYQSVPTEYSADAINLGSLFVPTGEAYAGIFSLAALICFALILKRTRLGTAIRAIRENRIAAASVGVDVDRISGVAFGIAFALTGAAGSLLSYLFSFFPGGHWQWVSILLALVAVGGMGSMLGSLVGALSLSVASSLVGHFAGATWAFLTFYVALLVILLVRPQGILGSSNQRARA